MIKYHFIIYFNVNNKFKHIENCENQDSSSLCVLIVSGVSCVTDYSLDAL